MIGDRIQKPGKERIVLSGTYSTPSGSGNAQLTWQAPGDVRFDRSDQSGKPLIATPAGLLSSAAVSPADSNILESLLDDNLEAFVYGFANGVSHRYLGGNSRAGDGPDPTKRYEIYETYGPVHTKFGSPLQLGRVHTNKT